jgi:hypothetical protein
MAAAVVLRPIADEGSSSLKLTSPPGEVTRNRFDIDEDYLASPTLLSRKRKEISPLDPSVLFVSVVRTPPSPSPSTQRTKKYARFDTGPNPDSNLFTLEPAALPPLAYNEYIDTPLVIDIQLIMNEAMDRIREAECVREAERV